MRITGFTGAVKKDVPMVVCTAEPNLPIGIGTNFSGWSGSGVLVKDITKYRYLICYLELDGGDKMFDIAKLPDVVVENHGSYRDFSGEFSVFGGTVDGSFYWTLDNLPESSVEIDLISTTKSGIPTETILDEDGKYVSGSVFILV